MTLPDVRVDRTTSQLTPARIMEVVQHAGVQSGLDTAHAQLIKFTNNAVVRLPLARAVIRIAGSTVTRRRLPGVISAARWFADHGIDAVRLFPGMSQPLIVGDHLATVWVEVAPTTLRPHPADLARVLKQIHAVPGPYPDDIPPWSLPSGLRQRLNDAQSVDRDTIDYLSAELDSAEAALTNLNGVEPFVPPGLVHGDAHLGNLIPSPTGTVICDFDSTSIGRREWDLTPAAVGALRFHYVPDVHKGIVEGYGVDVTTWEGFPTLRKLRELQLVTSVLPVLASNPALRPQWQHRLATYRSGDEDAIWTPYDSAVKS